MFTTVLLCRSLSPHHHLSCSFTPIQTINCSSTGMKSNLTIIRIMIQQQISFPHTHRYMDMIKYKQTVTHFMTITT